MNLARVVQLMLAFLGAVAAQAEVRLPAIISDHMVLQKASRVPIWGWADPGESVSVTLDGQTVVASANPNGKWVVFLDLENSAPGPFELFVKGVNQIVIRDVVVGEVWLAGGQSNMAWVLRDIGKDAAEAVSSAESHVREFAVALMPSETPLEDCKGIWKVASPSTVGRFSAVGYYFARMVNRETGAFVGIINNAWSGTPIEGWISNAALDSSPVLRPGKEKRVAVFDQHPAKRQAFAEAFAEWVAASAREDVPSAGIPDESSVGWSPINLPGEVPGPGVFWLRRSVDLPPGAANGGMNIILGAFDGFDQVYWNGELLASTDWKDFPGVGYERRPPRYLVPNGNAREGANAIAIRVYAPWGGVKFASPLRISNVDLDGEWFLKYEKEFPALDAAALAKAPRPPQVLPNLAERPSALFNGVMNPVIPYGIRGFLWYQGESNAPRAWEYRTAFPLFIADLRERWGRGDLPFYFCQLAEYQPKSANPGDSAWAELREAQTAALKVPNTGQAILIGTGEAADIHPRNKKDVGERLARLALARSYGKNIPYSGPVFDSAHAEGNAIRVKFTHADGGLVAAPVPATHVLRSAAGETAPLVRNSPGGELEGFAICGADRKWHWAEAKIDRDTVVVSSPVVSSPVAVRYAWADNPTGNLTNSSGLPAGPFRTDEFPARTLDIKY